MRWQISPDQIASYERDGFVVVEDFLDAGELDYWRTVVDRAVADRDGRKFANQDIKNGEDDGINPDADYYGKVFDQMLNLWQSNDEVRQLVLDPHIGQMACDLAGIDGVRVWHDQALYKRPWGNPTGLHLDTPIWSFFDRDALSIWIALDDATVENGCLVFLPGSHQITTFDNPMITKNFDAIFDMYPQCRTLDPVHAVMRAGTASFHNGMCIHGAGANVTAASRRAMTCAFMPMGATFNGQQNILTAEQMQSLTVGDELADEGQNPVVFAR